MEGEFQDFRKLLSMKGYVYQVPDKNRAATVRISVEDDILVFRTAKRLESRKPLLFTSSQTMGTTSC